MTTYHSLSTILTIAQPLGPVEHEWVKNSLTDDLIDDQIAIFRDAATRPHMLFLGRKGSGKSALLAEIKMTAMNRGGGLTSDELPKRGGNFVLPVVGWPHFHRIVKTVSRLNKDDELLGELIPAEHFAKLWSESLWDEIITYFYEYAHHPESRGLLGPVDKYINVEGEKNLAPEVAAERLLEAAKRAVISFLNARNSRLYFLFDSMENYPVRNSIFVGVMSGLFQGLASLTRETPSIIVSFCIPEEIEGFLAAGSANLLKDFASSFRIRWKPIELIRIAAYRLKLSSRIHDEELYVRIKDFDLASRQDLKNLFSYVFPTKITNSQGTDETPWAYIIRHTQLLPRQVLIILNTALSEQLRLTGSYTGMSEEVVRNGVAAAQRFIAQQILVPYGRLYPKLLLEARRILPDLEPICDYQTLRKVETRFDRRIEEDIGSVWQTLFEMGVLGRSTGTIGDDHHSLANDGRYCYGQFHFNADMAFGFATDGEYCFHPVFSREFGITRRRQDPRVVYPANMNLTDVYAE